MAPRKPHIARTYAPIHFDDLDPHRFEDLVRELIYDFKDWQAIEATGRAGSDDGFDIRAFEKVARVTPLTDDDDEDDPHPMAGRRWMIQGKREKTIGPADLKKILADVEENDPPYGYILAASAVFSKKSYDVFREILREKGVMEFYAWGVRSWRTCCIYRRTIEFSSPSLAFLWLVGVVRAQPRCAALS